MTSLSALFNFKSLTSLPTFKISASKSDEPFAVTTGATTGVAASAGVRVGLFSFKEIMIK
jgi:hypothetical protein